MIDNVNKSVVTNRPRDCLACKLIGGFGLSGAGAYVAKQGSTMKRGYGRTFCYSFALGAVGLGVARLLDLPPFDSFHHTPSS